MGGGYEMYIVFLYLGFNLLNISKTAAPDSSLCGSGFCYFLPTETHSLHVQQIFFPDL